MVRILSGSVAITPGAEGHAAFILRFRVGIATGINANRVDSARRYPTVLKFIDLCWFRLIAEARVVAATVPLRLR